MPDTSGTIFISYAHTDSPFVYQLEADLRQHGFTIWVDHTGLSGGQKWRRELQAAIDRSNVLLVVLSPEAVASEYVQIEYGYAADEGKLVIPIYYRPCKVPMELRNTQWIDFQHTYDQGLAAWLHALHQHADTASPSASSVLSSPRASQPVERPWNVPFARNPLFTGRAQLLDHLHEQLSSSQSTTLTKSSALSGLGGIGKTQTAIEYAYHYRNEYTAVFWVHADSRETLIADFVAIARLLSLSGQDEQDQMQTVAAVKRWLEQHEGWLLILDNADELSLLTTFLPTTGKGYVLLTTRAQATGKLARSLPVEKMEFSEAMQLLLRRAKLLEDIGGSSPVGAGAAERSGGEARLAPDGELTTKSVGANESGGLMAPSSPDPSLRRDESSSVRGHSKGEGGGWEWRGPLRSPFWSQLDKDERAAAQKLVEELDGLPLALDQAGAYIEETGCSLSDYLALYSSRRLSLLKRESSMATDYPHTVASTWALSFSQVEQADAAAADLLRLCAFLHPDAIPEAFFIEGAAELESGLSSVATDPLLLNEAIHLLRHYSLIKRDPQAKALNVHRLVQVVLKESLDAAAQRQWAERAVRVVNVAFPEVQVTTWDRCELCLPHAQVCAALIEQYSFTFPEAGCLLHSAGIYLRERGRYAQAEPLLQHALSIREQVLGAEHADTASTLNMLAYVYMLLSKHQQAEPLLQQALGRYERVLGPQHPEVATALDDLAAVYMYTSRYAQAEPLFQRALAIRKQVLGPNHPDVASSLNSLAMLYQYQGKYGQAEPPYQRALALFEETRGPEHPETLVALGNLAELSTLQGKYRQAEPLLQRVLTTRERVLGPEHSDTVLSIQKLGFLYTLQGKYGQAEPLLQQALALNQRILGPEHAITAINLLYLAQLYQAKYHDAQAESLYQQALMSFERIRGPKHPDVAETLTHLAQLSMRQSRYTQAEPLLQRALSIDEHALGSEHPKTAMVLDALGHLAFLQERNEQAEQLLQRALAIREQRLGNDHPDVAQTLQHLAEFYEKQGKYEQAQSLLQRALSIRQQALGPEHPDTLATQQAIATLHKTLQK